MRSLRLQYICLHSWIGCGERPTALASAVGPLGNYPTGLGATHNARHASRPASKHVQPGFRAPVILERSLESLLWSRLVLVDVPR
ncbi:uncharacterized protein M421DRAFT_139160 [Didymella exigua CBS 183.55]|uniref:Uncharacterized protein n=1 Tax=Didymella exigua CBS 183.55 TaxID=1150837 RepID=A0A6A5RM08_9PLEO|nr:uncharacterized protein M421DRAFT_139160 [Didymella exigua CBS 183.55]KAF1929455.1 hypothetical protein M421DRAFT_139160 [Didymella exigua CBS 183.55]